MTSWHYIVIEFDLYVFIILSNFVTRKNITPKLESLIMGLFFKLLSMVEVFSIDSY